MAREQLRVCWALCSGRQDAKGKAPVVPTLRLLAKAEWASLPQRLIFPFPCQPCVRSKRNSFRPSAPSADFHWARHPGLSSAVVAPSRGVLQSEVHGCSRSGSSLGASVFASAMVIVRFVNSAEAEQVQSGLPIVKTRRGDSNTMMTADFLTGMKVIGGLPSSPARPPLHKVVSCRSISRVHGVRRFQGFETSCTHASLYHPCGYAHQQGVTLLKRSAR